MTFATYPSLAGRTVFVSGGATGIGADIVRAFASHHAHVAFVDVQRREGEATVAAVKAEGGTALFLACDVTDIPALQARIAEARAKLGPIAVLVNNAANDERHAVADVTADYWDRAQNVNLRHHFFAAQAVHPQMCELGHGSIINLSSIAWRGAAEMPAYATAKAGVIGLTHALARAFGSDNIRVNAIEPGAVMTDRQRRLWYKTPESIDAIVKRQAIKSDAHRRGHRAHGALSRRRRQPHGHQAVDHRRCGASMNEIAKALQPEARGQAFAFGLNPYGLTYHLGLQGAGGPRANPRGAGLDGFIAIATELGASVLEIYDPWLRALSDDELRALRDRLAGLGMIPIVSSGLMMGPFESALRSARILDAKVIRHGLTTVLCGDRHALGDKWKELVAEVRAALAERGPRAADEGRVLAIENHQDFGSDELAEFCETTSRGRHLPRHRQHISRGRGAARLRPPRRVAMCGTCT